jgi:hypothetical protein
MMIVKLVYNVDHGSYAANEGAAFPFDTAVKLIATKVCRIDNSEPNKEELAAAANAYRAPKRAKYWEMPIVSRLGRELIAAFGLRNR